MPDLSKARDVTPILHWHEKYTAIVSLAYCHCKNKQ